MAPRPYWKGHLRLSLVSCPIALYPATSEGEKISFHQINSETGNRIRYKKVDSETGDEVDSGDIIKGYEASKGRYIQVESKSSRRSRSNRPRRSRSMSSCRARRSTICMLCARTLSPGG
jgi:Ku protein